jgi:hypothetical protein
MANHVSAADPLLFTKTLEFAGVFRDGDLATKPLSIEIRYSPLNAHPPVGIIRGTAADWPGLESFSIGDGHLYANQKACLQLRARKDQFKPGSAPRD